MAIDNGTLSDEDTDTENNEMDTTDCEDEEDDSQKQEHKNIAAVRKLFPDYHVSFGDGGEANLDYPVYCLDDKYDPPSWQELRKRLSSQLRAVDKLRQDVQPNGIVHDIVDPSLHGRVLSDNEVVTEISRLDSKNKKTYGETISDEVDFDDLDEEEEKARQQGRRGKEEYEEVKKKRGRFQWVPSVVRCTYSSSKNESQGYKNMNSQGKPMPEEQNKWTARFQSPIAGVPERRFAKQFYEDVEAVLSSMLPMFVKLGILKKGDQDGNQQQMDLQIITKVQEYQLPPKAKYTGRWHTEGFTERIKAAGVYYIDTETGHGGDLVFRPPSTPGKGYDSCARSYQPRDETAFCAANPFGRSDWSQMDFVKIRDHHPDDEEIDYTKGHCHESIAKMLLDEVLKTSSNSTNEDSNPFIDAMDAVVKRIITEASIEPDSNKKSRIDTVVSGGKKGSNDNDNGSDQDNHLQAQNQELLDTLSETVLTQLRTKSIVRNSKIDRVKNFHLENINSFRRYEKTLEVHDGTTVAFSNTIPHRFNTIYSRFGGTRRLFINFFVVDPDDPLPITTANAASPARIRSILLQKGFLDGETDVAQLVTSFLGGYSHGDLLHRTVVRDQARAAMSAGRQHWKVQYFGNAGFLQFFPDARWNDQYWDTSSIGVKGRNYEHSAKSTDLGSGM